ncbi:heavy metal-binding domain-containing protein [Goodfellowiella coeruleoviolacea]|uniref:UPF0145 protein LX83_002855 n=1 Tax=Goodfellowiella coeruleoviolacea TaxID=334858 RepID=A0AAE3KF43_9PSEU|nr:heavy metal-binding domain-containing protein [Goodfellowiella coeruleoviolacea]MCP2165996.1 Uncharacterized conserved protein YbjQ, UPF0145 family [Goodfellowiella coeruleoviolacea]
MAYPQQPPPVLLSTMNEVPGFRVAHVFGEVFGLTVRSRNAFSDIGAGFKSLVGGEMRGYTKMLSDSRYEALGRLRESAASMGANAVLAMRFESGDIMPGTTEIAAYGTAVYLVPDTGHQPHAQPPQQQPYGMPPQQPGQAQQGQPPQGQPQPPQGQPQPPQGQQYPQQGAPGQPFPPA